MTFQQLQNVLAIYQAGSISLAAKNMFVSQSSLSVSLSSLESALGFPIFMRTAQGVLPTVEGMQVIEHASRICDSFQNLHSIRRNTIQNIHITFPNYEPLNQAYYRLLEENRGRRDIVFTQGLDTAEKLIQDTSTFKVDTGIVACPSRSFRTMEATMEEKGLHWEILGRYPVCIILGPGHPLYRQSAVTLRDLENDMLIETARKEVVRNSVLLGLTHLTEDKLLICSRDKIINELVARGLGYKIGRSPSQETIEKYQLRTIPVENLEDLLISITNPLHALPPEAARFLELVKEELAK